MLLFFPIEVNIQQHSTDETSSLALTVTNALCIQYFTEPSSNFSTFLDFVIFSFILSFLQCCKGVLKQLHGSFMVIAWLMAASTGLLMPRYMKKTWVGKQFMKKDLWFVVRNPLDEVQIYYRKCVMVPVNRSTTED